MRAFGLVGYPLGHSFSRRYFTEKFEREGIGAVYLNFELPDISMITGVLGSHPELEGFNVTIPHKKGIIPLLDDLSDEARRIGAVNCVKVCRGLTTGYNTDVYGFGTSLLRLIGDDRPAALILGTGGASLAARYVLDGLGVDYRLVSRTATADGLTYGELDDRAMRRYRLIINTTPLGTFPGTDSSPAIPYRLLTPSHYLFDMVYNPPVTRFLAQGAERGARTANGYDMLVAQAEKSWEIWNT